MSRPGPLQEWPLDTFLLTNYSQTPTTPTKSAKAQKRPLSPQIGVSQYSPAKRRILNDEGIVSPKKTMKSPLSGFGMDVGTPSRFSHILTGPESPARVLDFGAPKHAATPRRPTASPASGSSTALAPSPELKSSSSRASQPPQSPSRTIQQLPISSTGPQPRLEPLKIPRVPPACSAVGSIHYPGFQVYQDPFEYVYPAGSNSELLEPEEDPLWHKENLPPRRKAKKTASNPESSKLISDLTPKPPMKQPKASTLPPEWGSGEAVSELLSPGRILPSAIFPSSRADLRQAGRQGFSGERGEWGRN